MVTINFEPLESFPYIDDPITPEERHAVEQLVRVELHSSSAASINTNTDDGIPNRSGPLADLHPLVGQILPLSHTHGLGTPLLMQEIERYEEEHDEQDDDFPHFIHGGIDTSRYINDHNDHNDNNNDNNSKEDSEKINTLYATLSYSLLEQRNLTLLQENGSDVMAHLEQQHLQQIAQLRGEQENTVGRKRSQIDEINVIRKKRQVVDFKPVNDYLHERWKDGIKSVVDLGIEATRMEMDL